MIHPIRLIRSSSTPIRDIKFLNDSSNLIVAVANVAKRFWLKRKIKLCFEKIFFFGHLFFSVWDFDDCRQHLIDIENNGTESIVRSLTGDILCAKEFTPFVEKRSEKRNFLLSRFYSKFFRPNERLFNVRSGKQQPSKTHLLSTDAGPRSQHRLFALARFFVTL